jgi:hypothetical protein
MFTPYAPRAIQFLGMREPNSWRLKFYSIAYGSEPIDWSLFAPGIAMAEEALPNPAEYPGRRGLGFLIAHRGRTADYVVLGWWDQENELPLRVFVMPPGRVHWRPAQGSESICVWDLEVIAFERDCFVATMLNGECREPERKYLARTLEK